ncbi:hypothetical protein F5B19DRAFT_232533 [Rostrohypoxylon terebratum]|nr:hypothetical protein F5B19DRAFT_232533 [Rostrohypoxylon terebratum]
MEMTPAQQSSQGSAAPKYTTVGSVWHPQTTPMQPPTRRGRTLRSVAPESLDHTFSATANHTAHYYSPLQQNFDRAVSPLPPDRQLFARISELEERPSLYSTTMSQQPTNQYLPSNELVLAAEQDEDIEDQEEDDGSEVGGKDPNFGYLNRMPTKSLTNLASYDNPMQKAAQRLLTRAKQFPLTITQQKSDITQENRSLLPPPGFGAGFKYNRSDPLGADGLLQSDRVDESGLPIRPLRQLNPNTSDSANHERDTYPAVLSKGPGAPLPLTAGPPGQRQFPSTYNSTNAFQKGPPAFDSSTGHWQKGFDQSRGFGSFEDTVSRLPQYPFTPFGSQQVTQPMGMSQQPTPSLISRAPSAQQYPAMNKGRESSAHGKMVDTLTYEEAKRFFPNGFPADFNQSYHPVPDNWVELRLKELEDQEKAKDQIAMQQTREWQEAHQAKLHRDFYSGYEMIHTDLETAVQEKSSRDIADFTSSFQGTKKAPGRIGDRQLSFQDIDETPTHEHAKPLLSLMYQSLANNPNITPHRSLPKYVVPPKKNEPENLSTAEGSQ